MVILSVIVGIILVICGFTSMFTPLTTFLYTGYFFGILLLVYGAVGIIRAIVKKDMNVFGIIVSIVALVFGIIAIARPGSTLVFDRIVLWLMAIWFIFQGAASIITNIQMRKEKKGWYWGLIVGILGVILGIYAACHPMFAALTAGLLIGFFFLQTGLNLISFALVANRDGGSED